MFENWITHCLPSLTIGTANILTETKLTGNWHGWPLLGYLDMLWFEDEGATAYICDVKTGNNLFYLPEKMWYSLQPDIYAALVRLNYPDVEDVYWRQHNVAVEGANITQRRVHQTSDRDAVLETWLRRMDKDDALPTESWECGRCPFATICEGRLQFGENERFQFYIGEEDDEAECGES